MKIYLIFINKIVSCFEVLVMKPFIANEIQQIQKLTAILVDVASQLNIVLLQEDGIMLLKLQSLY